MIAKLTGILDSSGPDRLVLDVAGVGYLVFASGAGSRSNQPLSRPVFLPGSASPPHALTMAARTSAIP